MDIKLEIFEGPLELLRSELKKNKISITDIDISLITDQYIEAIQNLSLDTISEFILMATELIAIKNKMLLWTPKEPDPREELVNRLEIYEFFREMALGLRSMENSGRVYRAPEVPEAVETLHIKYSVTELNDVYQALLKTFVPPEPESPTIPIEREQYQIEDKLLYLKELLSRQDRVSFISLLKPLKVKQEVVTLFMALLELIKDKQVQIYQEANFSDIVLIRYNNNA